MQLEQTDNSVTRPLNQQTASPVRFDLQLYAEGEGGGGESGSGGEGGGEKTFPESYVKTLRESNKRAEDETKKLAKKMEEYEAELGSFRTEKAELEKKKLEEAGEWKKLHEQTVSEYEEKIKAEKAERAKEAKTLKDQVSNYQKQRIKDNVKSLAKENGIIDETDLDNFDISDFRIADDGEIPGLKEKFAEFKAAKPHWFKTGGGGNGNGDGRKIGTPDHNESGVFNRNSADWGKLKPAEFLSTVQNNLGVTLK